MGEKEKQAANYLEHVRQQCRISHANGSALTGSEYDAIREAIAVLAALANNPQETVPKTE